MSWDWPLTESERRAAVLTARSVWLREMANDQALPLVTLERVMLRGVADRLDAVVRELQGDPCEPNRS
jgi:hypothetical protein